MIVKDILETNKRIFKASVKLMSEHHLLMYVGLIYGLIVYTTTTIGNMMFLFGGMIIFLGYSAVISNYFYLIHRATHGYKTDWDDVKQGFTVYLRKIFSVLFVVWVVNLGLRMFIYPILPFSLLRPFLLILPLAAMVILNALPETLYQKRLSELDSFRYAIDFFKNNLLEWGLPNALLLVLNYGVYRLLSSLVGSLFFSLPLSVAIALEIVILIVVLQFTLGYTMIYRGLLFKRLDSSTRQKRMFERRH